MPTHYHDFKKYLKNCHEKDLPLLEKLLFSNVSENDPWNDVELSISQNIISPMEMLSNVIQNHNRVYLNDIDSLTEIAGAYRKLIDLAGKWINSIKLECYNKLPNVSFRDDDVFLCFNYTKTLEKLYGINPDNICYIHVDFGRVVMGHDVFTFDQSIPYSPELLMYNGGTLNRNNFDLYPNEDVKNAYFASIANQIPYVCHKGVNARIERNESFFRNITKASSIINLGMSFKNADMYYLNHILHCRGDNRINYITVYHSSKSKQFFINYFKNCTMYNHDTRYYSWNQLSQAIDYSLL